jgi:phosphomethylpyrimidine synthase
MGKPEGRVNGSERVNTTLSGSSRVDSTQWLPQGEFRGLTKLVKTTEDVRKYAAEQGMSEDEALQAGMEQKSREFTEAGAEIYSKT